MSLDDFEIISKIGQGAYSTVYKVIRSKDSQIYALKKVKIVNLSSKEKQNSLNQIRILASLDSQFIVRYRQAFFDQQSKSLCLIMEYANNGDLLQKIKCKHKNQESFSQDEIWNIFISIVKGLKYLHSRKILHRDIKTANVFLHEIEAKLGDLNVSKISQQGLCMTQTGTPYYASPQVWKDQPYNEKSDIWSLGCVLYQMITLKPPFFSDDMQDLYKKVNRGIYAKIPKSFSSDLSTLIRMLLQVNPDSRPSCQKILNLQFIKQKLKDHSFSNSPVKGSLLRTIRATQNFSSLYNEFPIAKYQKQQKGQTIYPNQNSVHHKGTKKKNSNRKQIQILLQSQKMKTIRQTVSMIKKKNRKNQNPKQSTDILIADTQIQVLPILQSNDRKMTPGQNSERLNHQFNYFQRQKNQKYQKNEQKYEKYSMNAIISQRKKSLLQLYEKGSKKALQSCRINNMKHESNNDILELRLPKVYGRTRKNSQKLENIKQKNGKSMRSYKINL